MGLLAHFSFLGSFRINLGNKMDRQSQIRECIEPAVKVAGCELWGIEYLSQGRHATLRIFIEKDEGVQVEDCERVSKQVSAVLDGSSTSNTCLLYTSPSPRDATLSRMPSSA